MEFFRLGWNKRELFGSNGLEHTSSGESGSPDFLPGRSPNHLGNLAVSEKRYSVSWISKHCKFTQRYTYRVLQTIQMKLILFVSRQSWPFWAALKLLWISNMKFEYLILILWAKWMPIAFELQQVLSFVFINCFQIELCCLNSLKELDIVNWWHVIANWSSKCIKEMVLKVLSCSSCSPNDEKKR